MFYSAINYFFLETPCLFWNYDILINHVLKVVSSIPLLVLSPILLTYSIFYSMQELSKHWSNSESENYWSEQKPVQGRFKGTVDVLHFRRDMPNSQSYHLTKGRISMFFFLQKRETLVNFCHCHCYLNPHVSKVWKPAVKNYLLFLIIFAQNKGLMVALKINF